VPHLPTDQSAGSIDRYHEKHFPTHLSNCESHHLVIQWMILAAEKLHLLVLHWALNRHVQDSVIKIHASRSHYRSSQVLNIVCKNLFLKTSQNSRQVFW
jgi:hypothetical protein